MESDTTQRPPATPPPSDRLAMLRLEEVSRAYGNVPAVRDVSLGVEPGEFFSLLGPSGCGKTTLLRLVAGLDAPDHGRIWLEGVDVAHLSPHARPVNTVFQNYALFPHLRVQDNIAFGLRMKGVATPEIQRRVLRHMRLVDVESLAQRKPDQLSGGQKQRVALARALVNEPKLLLLDEPLGAADQRMRRQLQAELKRVQRQLRITFLHVTHDQEEALQMSDRIGVMREGRIEQVGTPADVYERPRTRFVADFLGGCNLLSGKPVSRPNERLLLETPIGRVRGAEAIPAELAHRAEVSFAFRPEQLRLRPPGGTGENTFAGVLAELNYSGATTKCVVDLGGALARVESPSHELDGALRPGSAVGLELPADAVIVLYD